MTNNEAIEALEIISISLPMTSSQRQELESAMSIAENAIEKQIPKKPRETRCALMCANCGHKITEKGCKKLNRNYCKKCGQAIDWGVSDDTKNQPV